jgi:RNA polymerase sigma factor (sigma-70 family)
MSRRSGGAELEEIEAVYRRRLAELRRVATAVSGSREAGLDAVQDAFARAIRQRSSFRGEGSLDAWLWQIVVNSARDVAARVSTLDPVGPDALKQDGAPSSLAEPGTAQALIRELPERQRLALFLRYYADLDYATIAEALDITTGTVGATLTQARESLQRLLREVGS